MGSTSFPLTWEEVDPDMAFDIGSILPSLDMAPGDSVTFSVSPRYDELGPGKYVASYSFYSANYIRRHHLTKVSVSITVKDNVPYVTSVDIFPSSVTVPAGKSYDFDVQVSGGNGFDPDA